MSGARDGGRAVAFACAALLAASAARAQTPANVTPAMAATVALIECNDGKTRTYQTGVVAGSNGVQSFVVSADLPGPDGKAFSGSASAHCNAPVVRFADDLATSYPAVRVPMDFSLPPSFFYALIVDHPRATVAQLAPTAPVDGQPVVLVGFDIGGAADATQANVTALRQTYASSFALGAIRTFGSTSTLRGAALLDASTGRLLGMAAPAGPFFRTDGPPITAYDLAARDTIAGLLHAVVPPAAPGATPLQATALQAARLGLAVRRVAPLLMLSSASAGRGALAADGFAVIVGATATSTIVATSYLRSSGAPAIAVARADGRTDVLPATVVASDAATALAFLAIPKLDLPTPAFGAPPPVGAVVAIPQVDGFACVASPPAPGTNECPISVRYEHVIAPPAANPTALGVTAPSTMVVDSGAPVIDPRTGAIVGISVGGTVAPMAIVALKADAFDVGVKIVVPP